MKEDVDSCSLPSDAVYLNVRRSVITARECVSQSVPIWNALRSEIDGRHYLYLKHILNETEHFFNERICLKIRKMCGGIR